MFSERKELLFMWPCHSPCHRDQWYFFSLAFFDFMHSFRCWSSLASLFVSISSISSSLTHLTFSLAFKQRLLPIYSTYLSVDIYLFPAPQTDVGIALHDNHQCSEYGDWFVHRLHPVRDPLEKEDWYGPVCSFHVSWISVLIQLQNELNDQSAGMLSALLPSPR